MLSPQMENRKSYMPKLDSTGELRLKFENKLEEFQNLRQANKQEFALQAIQNNYQNHNNLASDIQT